MNRINYFHGIKDGIPICLGYISVSFAFGVFAVGSGLSVLETVLLSATNLASAGQLAAVPIIAGGGSLIELILSEFIINIRYSLMSVSLSQKLDPKIKLRQKLLISFANTDEVFAVSSMQIGKVGKSYMYGLILTPYLGWTAGTLLGALAGDILPRNITSALGVALYGMFFSIVVPPVKHDRSIAMCVLIAVALRCVFRYVPGLSDVPDGFAVIICAVSSCIFFAYRDSKKDKKEREKTE